MIYRISAHERLVDIAHAHGTTTDVICAANPHKRAVELPGVGAVFEDMRAGEEISVPGVGDLPGFSLLKPYTCQPGKVFLPKGYSLVVTVTTGGYGLSGLLVSLNGSVVEIPHAYWQAKKVGGGWAAVVAPNTKISAMLALDFFEGYGAGQSPANLSQPLFSGEDGDALPYLPHVCVGTSPLTGWGKGGTLPNGSGRG